MTVDENDEALTAASVRYVRTSQGARRFGVPVGSLIRVGSHGQVQVVKKGGGAVPAGPRRAAPPTKFVPTVPGQVAKLPSSVLQHATPQQRVSQRRAEHARMAAAVGRNQTNRAQAQRALRLSKVTSLIGKISPAHATALSRVQSGKSLSPAQRSAAISAIKHMINKLEHPGGKSKSTSTSKTKKSSSKKTAAKKKGFSKAASTKGGKTNKGSAHHGGRKKGYSKTQWLNDLKSLLKRLEKGGGAGGGGKGKGGGAGSGHAKPAAKHKSFPTSFSGMTQKQLLGEIRSLAVAARSDPQAKQSLALAQQEHGRRAGEEEKRRRMLSGTRR